MKIVRKISRFLFYGALLILSADILLVIGIAKLHQEPKKADAIIILGAAINSPALYNRTLEGLDLYKKGKADVLVLSGGRISTQDISEAGYMKKVILKNSPETTNFLLDEKSNNTEENLRNTKKLIPNAKSVIIVSDEFHLARGAALALRNGFYPVYVSSPKPDYYNKSELAWYYFREIVAMVAYIPAFVFNH